MHTSSDLVYSLIHLIHCLVKLSGTRQDAILGPLWRQKAICSDFKASVLFVETFHGQQIFGG